MKKHFRNIVICGDIGTGTTTLGKGLAVKLGWKFLSIGDIFRSYHKEHNIPLWDKAAIPEALEREVDASFMDRVTNEKHIIFDGHYLAWLARNLDDVYRILLICDKEVATKRILKRQHTHKETLKEIEERRKQLREKFKKIYSKANYENPKLFHLVLNTTDSTPEETLKAVLAAFKKSW